MRRRHWAHLGSVFQIGKSSKRYWNCLLFSVCYYKEMYSRWVLMLANSRRQEQSTLISFSVPRNASYHSCTWNAKFFWGKFCPLPASIFPVQVPLFEVRTDQVLSPVGKVYNTTLFWKLRQPPLAEIWVIPCLLALPLCNTPSFSLEHM